jgi:hypothetical protein
MTNEIEVTIYTEDQSRVSLSEWDDGGAWLKIGVRSGGAYTVLTREEAQQLLEGLQAILAKEVTA